MPRTAIPFVGPYSKRKYDALTGGKKRKVAPNIKNYVKRAIAQKEDIRFTEESASQSEVYSTATFTDLHDSITDGDLSNQREGDNLVITKMRFDITVAPKTSAYASNFCRFWIVQWMADTSDTASPAFDQILYDSTTAPVLQRQWQENAGNQLRILYDSKVFEIPPYLSGLGGSVLAGKKNRMFRFTIPGKKIRQLRYNQGAETGSGHVFIVWRGNTGTGDQTAVIDYVARTYFRMGKKK